MSEHENAEAPDRMLNRIRALLRKAEDKGATKAESEAFFAKAAELMARHGINTALLESTAPTGPQAADRFFDVLGPYVERKAELLYHVAEALGCKAILLGKRGSDTMRVHLFGIGSDLDRADIMFTSLLLQLHRFIALDFTRDPKAQRSARKWRGDYIRGFTSSVASRIRQAENAAKDRAKKDTGMSVALVLTRRTDLVAKAFAERYPTTVTRSASFNPGSGFVSGHAAGQRADLGGTSLTDRSRPGLPG